MAYFLHSLQWTIKLKSRILFKQMEGFFPTVNILCLKTQLVWKQDYLSQRPWIKAYGRHWHGMTLLRDHPQELYITGAGESPSRGIGLSHRYHAVLTASLCLSSRYTAYAGNFIFRLSTFSVSPPRCITTAISACHLLICSLFPERLWQYDPISF